MIILEKLHLKLKFVNGSIDYIKNISLTNVKWIKKDVIMCPPINILVNFNEFTKKQISLQNITFKGLSQNVIPISRNLIISSPHIGVTHFQSIHKQ